MRLPLWVTPFFAILAVAQNISFINPGPSGPDSEYSMNPSFPYGSNIVIQWTPTSYTISLVMYQQTQNAEFEYIFRKSLCFSLVAKAVLTRYPENRQGLSSYNWDITTTKSLSVSRIFFFEIFVQGDTSPAAVSHYFNVTGSVEAASSSSSSASPTGIPTSSATSRTSPSSTDSSTPASSASGTSTPSSNSDGGLSLGAKVGLGVGIPIAVIGGLLVGWFFFGRKKKRNSNNNPSWMQPEHSVPEIQPYYGHERMNYPSMGMQKPHELDNPPGSMAMNKPHELDTPPVQPAELSHEYYR